MKPYKAAIILLSLMLTSVARSQINDSNKEATSEVRRIDNAEREAVLAQDLTQLEKYWAEEFVVNAPNNEVVRGRIAVLELVRAGLIDYTLFERKVEELTVNGDTAIVMGLETVKPKGKAPLTGQYLLNHSP